MPGFPYIEVLSWLPIGNIEMLQKTGKDSTAGRA